MKLRFELLNKSNWKAFEKLFGEKGACEGCWCMSWRLHAKEYKLNRGAKNKKAMKKLAGQSAPGILAFSGEDAVGWCAVAPRHEYLRLENSRVLQPVDEKPVWSVSCFFIEKTFRNKGISMALLKAASDFAFSQGAIIVEGYPVEPRKGKMADVFAWTGIPSVFKKAGFKEVIRRSETRPIMRLKNKMNNKILIFAVIFSFFVLSFINNHSENKMNAFRWMSGTWKMETKRGVILESWNATDDSTLLGVSVLVNKNLDTSMLEEISLSYRGGKYFYIPVAIGQNNDEPVKFSITSFDESGFVSENPEHDFPKRISYQKLNNDSLHVFIDGGPAQPEKRSNFYFSRLKK